ncbi:hypothetical protein BDV29DRAFT_153829 [Aspergillus leporis]|uniref:Uncharacterized protein n=1 Tax=Aspergillus leporis TaxID=41062 RepID=A0A5N5XAX1_9EURO|nr:hypothetical protein BDV29DRAFT_153829 [Aspergillus leporis]
MAMSFFQQGQSEGKALLNVSTSVIHSHSGILGIGAYAATKSAFANFLQQLSSELGPGKAQIIDFHPGVVLSPAGRKLGLDESSFSFNDTNLLGRFSVWAASADAAFLHGRFVWASWDIDEFRELKPKILDDPGFLKLGLLGTASFDFPTFLQTQLCKEH